MAKTKLVYVNEPDVWDYLSSLKNFSAWVRDRARQEMSGGVDPAIKNMVERLINEKMASRVGAVSHQMDANIDQFF